MKTYRAIFNKIESSLIRVGSDNLPKDEIQARLDEYKKTETKTFTDADCYRILVHVIFYSGFKAATVTAKLPVIDQHFPDYNTVAGYTDSDTGQILTDPQMIKNKRKIQACVQNAQTFRRIVHEHGSFQAYIASFSPRESFENLLLLKEELQYHFSGLGEITTYHVLTDIGLPVLKPDRVITRIFHRLGLVESEKQLLKAVIQGRKFARATGHPIRYIDIVFVAYGQVQSTEFGLKRGICLKNNPACLLCGVQIYCQYFAQT
ncbi:MAG: DNA-3-methyladenine glycosylase I [Chloroflexi bacterium]|nr:DNA-3-methyladenine glycosylase I [Chloroflexota bacterium]